MRLMTTIGPMATYRHCKGQGRAEVVTNVSLQLLQLKDVAPVHRTQCLMAELLHSQCRKKTPLRIVIVTRSKWICVGREAHTRLSGKLAC